MATALRQKLQETARTITIVAGPRQVGKTTLITSILKEFPGIYHSADPADIPSSRAWDSNESLSSGSMRRDGEWLAHIWTQARHQAAASDAGFVLAIDEIQKVPQWSEVVKGLWDQDRREGTDLRVVLLGSAQLLMQAGLRESLMGRFETIHLGHWSYPEMHDAFGYSLDEYLYFGGYPGAAPLKANEPRWRAYVRDALIEPSIGKDILQLNRVDKPALLRQLFRLGCDYSGQILAFSKMVPHLQEDGGKNHTLTLSHYLDLMSQAELLAALQKYSGSKLRRRASSPKLNVLNTALMSVETGYDYAAAQADRTHWGRLAESAVGAHLFNTGHPDCEIYYWAEGSVEVDFVVARGRLITAIEVKSGRKRAHSRGFDAFAKEFGNCKTLEIGNGGISFAEFFSYPAGHWL